MLNEQTVLKATADIGQTAAFFFIQGTGGIAFAKAIRAACEQAYAEGFQNGLKKGLEDAAKSYALEKAFNAPSKENPSHQSPS